MNPLLSYDYNNITTPNLSHNINTPTLYPICIISTSPISAATILVSPSSNYSIISTPTISTSVTTPLFAHNIIIITQSLSQQYHHLHHQSLPPPPPSQYIIISQSLPRSIISTSPNQHALTISPSPNLYCIHNITTNLISTPTISVHDPISAPIISISPIYTPQYSTVPQSLHHKLIISTFPNLCPHKITICIPNLTPIISISPIFAPTILNMITMPGTPNLPNFSHKFVFKKVKTTGFCLFLHENRKF